MESYSLYEYLKEEHNIYNICSYERKGLCLVLLIYSFIYLAFDFLYVIFFSLSFLLVHVHDHYETG